jgi:hypothetical protein
LASHFKDNTFRVFQNKLLRGTVESEAEEVTGFTVSHNELHNMYVSPNLIGEMKPKRRDKWLILAIMETDKKCIKCSW